MKKTIIATLSVLTLLSCNKLKENEYLLKGSFQGISDGTYLIIEKSDEFNEFVSIDSTLIKNEKFEFKGIFENPDFYYLHVKNVPGKIQFIVENGTIEVVAYKDSLNQSQVTGTLSNDRYKAFKSVTEEVNKRRAAFQEANMSKFMEAQQNQDMETVDALMKENEAFDNEIAKIAKNEVKDHPNSFLSVLLLSQLVGYPGEDAKELLDFLNKMPENLKNTRFGKSAKEKLEAMNGKVGVGQKAPNFSAPGVDGNPVSLYDHLGKVTVKHLRAAWCGPCRKENPIMVSLYETYKDRGLEIFGVSLDQPGKGDDWKQAIAADRLTWTQVSNLKFWDDPIAAQFGVQAIPATFILDANGIIIARDLRGEDLKAKIEELLMVP
jgi:peroxiredoxin